MNLRRRVVLAVPLLMLLGPGSSIAAEQAGAAAPLPDLASLQQQIEDLKRLLPGQAHVMADVEHHFSNLWYAAHAQNWPLATFYMNESRFRIGWAVRLRPVRPLPGGAEIDLRPLFARIEQSAYADLKMALDKHDVPAFETAYKKGLNECYDCHRAIDKAFLRPEIPRAPGTSLIAVEPL
jgi:hypothetical protein